MIMNVKEMYIKFIYIYTKNVQTVQNLYKVQTEISTKLEIVNRNNIQT